VKKFVILLFSVVIVASFIFAGCAAPTVVPTEPTPTPSVPQVVYPDEIKIGIPLHLTGSLAVVGQGQKIAIDYTIKQINDMGGIKNMGGAKLVALTPDTQLVPDIAVSETERLITQEGVVDTVGTYMHGEEVAITSQRLKCPCTQFQTIMPPTMTEEDWYISRIFNDEWEDFLDNQAAYTSFNEDKGVAGPKTVAFLYCDSVWCTEAVLEGPRMMEEWGAEVVEIIPYNCGQSTFKTEIAKLKAAAPDHLILFMHTAGHIVFNREMMEERVSFPYGIATQGGEDAAIYDTLPEESYRYMFIQEDGDIWFRERCYGKELGRLHEEGLGVPLATYASNHYQGMWMVKQALERTEYSPDIQTFRDNFQKAYLATNITMDTCPDPMYCDDGTFFCPQLTRTSDSIAFLPSGHAKSWEQIHGQLSQLLGGVRVPMWPKETRPPGYEDALVWPVPGWDEILG